MSRILIIGFGNPLRSDDGVGWRAAEELEHKLSGSGVEVITCHQLTPELADTVQPKHSCILPGRPMWRAGNRYMLTGKAAGSDVRLFPTNFLPLPCLDWRRSSTGKAPLAFTFSIFGECFDAGETLSPQVRKNLPDLVARVAAMACASGIDSPPR